jgi:hypothetical protein
MKVISALHAGGGYGQSNAFRKKQQHKPVGSGCPSLHYSAWLSLLHANANRGCHGRISTPVLRALKKNDGFESFAHVKIAGVQRSLKRAFAILTSACRSQMGLFLSWVELLKSELGLQMPPS